jgi:L-alanine-DL-glutamate epimerase-like enolase superfamily enzyme
VPDHSAPCVTDVSVRVFTVPTDRPEADGTLAWSETTLVLAEVAAGGNRGMGWTYASGGCRPIIEQQLSSAVSGANVLDVPRCHEKMVRACRNLGRPGIVSCAISAVDIALWDCKARLLGVALSSLFGRSGDDVKIYGSGGFTTYDETTATQQLERWTEAQRIPRVKIKIGESWGSCEDRDLARIRHARRVIGPDVELYVDANGAYSAKQAVRFGQRMQAEADVIWFEEPVSSDDLEGLRTVRHQLALDVAAGEYGYDEPYFERMLGADAVDCLQIDVTRCGGYTSWLRAAALAGARSMDVSGHCAPNLHAHVAAAMPNVRHVEYFWDHERIETMFFDGVLDPGGGILVPDPALHGHGLTLKEADVRPFES